MTGAALLGTWTDRDGVEHEIATRTEYQAIMEVSRQHYGGLRFHDLRHSYATWLVDDGDPPNMVQRAGRRRRGGSAGADMTLDAAAWTLHRLWPETTKAPAWPLCGGCDQGL